MTTIPERLSLPAAAAVLAAAALIVAGLREGNTQTTAPDFSGNGKVGSRVAAALLAAIRPDKARRERNARNLLILPERIPPFVEVSDRRLYPPSHDSLQRAARGGIRVYSDRVPKRPRGPQVEEDALRPRAAGSPRARSSPAA
jgi:hypothetical protein